MEPPGLPPQTTTVQPLALHQLAAATEQLTLGDVQALLTQVVPPPHTMPQPPQLELLAVVLSSQPSVFLLLLQSANPALHVPLHTPPPQVGDAMLAAEHTAVDGIIEVSCGGYACCRGIAAAA